MAAAKSTRLAIVEQSLADILERLADLHPTESTVMKLRELRTKAFAYERTVKVLLTGGSSPVIKKDPGPAAMTHAVWEAAQK